MIFSDVKYYNIALSEVRNPEGITHFPDKIPPKAKDVNFYAFSGGLYHQYVFLEFSIDKDFIKQELSKYNYLTAISSSYAQNLYGFSYLNNSNYNIDKTKYTYYPINNEINRMLYNRNTFPYFSGIGIDNSHTHIFYYFANPEG